LGQSDRSGTDPFCAINSKCNRKRLKSEFSVSFNGFEIVDNGDSKSSNGVENGPKVKKDVSKTKALTPSKYEMKRD